MDTTFDLTVIFKSHYESMDAARRLTQMGLDFDVATTKPSESAIETIIVFYDESSAALAKLVLCDQIERFVEHRELISTLFRNSIAMLNAQGIVPLQQTHSVVQRSKGQV